jgi:toxin CptA
MLRIDLRRSRQLALLLGAVHAAALGLGFAAGLPWWVNLLLAVAVAVSAAHTIALHAWHSLHASLVALELSDECQLKVQDHRGEWRNAELLPSTFVTPRLTVLNLRFDGARLARHIIIVPDRVDAEAFRRLRVLLRWKCGGGAMEAKTVILGAVRFPGRISHHDYAAC